MRTLSRAVPLLCVLVLSLCVTPSQSADEVKAPAALSRPVNGTLREVQGIPVLTLWGTPYEMGYAHGFLLGPEIMEMWDRVLVGGKWGQYVIGLPEVIELVAILDHQLEELSGVLAGMSDNPRVQLYVPELGRDFSVEDLIVLNCTDFRMCEATALWGDLTAGGSTITARNFGWGVIPQSYCGTTMLDNTMLFAYHPSRPNTRRHFTVSWPGILGCSTGMNEAGVTLYINNAGDGENAFYSPNPPTPHSLSPAILVMREVLETGDSADPVYAAFEAFQSVRLFKGAILMVASPYTGDMRETAGVIEADSEGEVLRLSSDDYPGNPNRIFACNRYQKYHSVRYDLSYRAMELGVGLIENLGGGAIGDRGIRSIMAFAASASGFSTTQHSAIFHPNDLTFEIYIGEVVGGLLRSAPYCQGHTFSWQDLWMPDE